MAGIDPISNVADAAGTVSSAVATIIGLFKANPNIKVEGDVQLEQTALAGQIQEVLAQIQVNAIEAANKSIFVAGWRPWVGWVGGTALGTPFLIYVIQSIVMIVRGALTGHFETFPAPDTTVLLTALGSILGLGTMRTIEKTQGAAGNAAH